MICVSESVNCEGAGVGGFGGGVCLPAYGMMDWNLTEAIPFQLG
jgi:hypothetical protein